MSDTFYRQALMHRETEAGVQEYVAWIPADKAVIGRVLKICFDGVWIDGWKVIDAGPRRREKLLQTAEQNARHGLRTFTCEEDPRSQNADRGPAGYQLKVDL